MGKGEIARYAFVFKRLIPQTRKKPGLVWERVKHLPLFRQSREIFEPCRLKRGHNLLAKSIDHVSRYALCRLIWSETSLSLKFCECQRTIPPHTSVSRLFWLSWIFMGHYRYNESRRFINPFTNKPRFSRVYSRLHVFWKQGAGGGGR